VHDSERDFTRPESFGSFCYYQTDQVNGWIRGTVAKLGPPSPVERVELKPFTHLPGSGNFHRRFYRQGDGLFIGPLPQFIVLPINRVALVAREHREFLQRTHIFSDQEREYVKSFPKTERASIKQQLVTIHYSGVTYNQLTEDAISRVESYFMPKCVSAGQTNLALMEAQNGPNGTPRGKDFVSHPTNSIGCFAGVVFELGPDQSEPYYALVDALTCVPASQHAPILRCVQKLFSTFGSIECRHPDGSHFKSTHGIARVKAKKMIRSFLFLDKKWSPDCHRAWYKHNEIYTAENFLSDCLNIGQTPEKMNEIIAARCDCAHKSAPWFMRLLITNSDVDAPWQNKKQHGQDIIGLTSGEATKPGPGRGKGKGKMTPAKIKKEVKREIKKDLKKQGPKKAKKANPKKKLAKAPPGEHIISHDDTIYSEVLQNQDSKDIPGSGEMMKINISGTENQVIFDITLTARVIAGMQGEDGPLSNALKNYTQCRVKTFNLYLHMLQFR